MMTFRELDIGLQDFLPMAQQILSSGIGLRFRAQGNSMSPLIRHNDTVLLARVDRHARLGDVVLARTGDQRLVLHRVVKKNCHGFVTRGDACPMPDPEIILPHNILGRVVVVAGKGCNFHLRAPWRLLLGRYAALFFCLRRLRAIGGIAKKATARLN